MVRWARREPRLKRKQKKLRLSAKPLRKRQPSRLKLRENSKQSLLFHRKRDRKLRRSVLLRP